MLAQAEVEQYRREAKDAREMEAAALEINDALESENARLNDSVYRMQMEVERLNQTLIAAEKPVVIPIPDSLSDLAEWAETYVAGRVVLLPRAVREAKKSYYEAPGDVFDALLMLANEYWRVKTGNGDQSAFDARLAQLGMEFGISIAEQNANDSYYVAYDGRKRFLDRAVKKVSRTTRARRCASTCSGTTTIGWPWWGRCRSISTTPRRRRPERGSYRQGEVFGSLPAEGIKASIRPCPGALRSGNNIQPRSRMIRPPREEMKWVCNARARCS